MNAETKPWYESRTIVASIVSSVTSVIAIIGFNIPIDTATDLVFAILPVIANMAAIWGRLDATATIGKPNE